MQINPGREYDMPSDQPQQKEDLLLLLGKNDKLKAKNLKLKSQQKEQFSREDMLKVIKIAYDNGESNATRQYGDGWDTSNPEKLLTEYLNSKK